MAMPWSAPGAASPASLSLAPPTRMALKLEGAAVTTLPTGGHDWNRQKSGDSVSAELTYVLPAQGRMVPYVGLRVTHFMPQGPEQRVLSTDSPADSEYGVGARSGLTLITGRRGRVHMGVAYTFSEPPSATQNTFHLPSSDTPDTSRLDLALVYSIHF
ncbi:MAG: hypothetical protein OEY97_01115 [Nitrospirota bacterium]|nr:hypothetical protein [Nitrospirota bacterium]